MAPVRRATRRGHEPDRQHARPPFHAAGGLPGELFLGDITLTRALQARGTPLMFEPSAVVEHHHEETFASFMRTRYVRGVWYGEMRTTGRLRALILLAVTVLPVRLPRIAVLTALHIAKGAWPRWVAAFPLAMLGHVASLAGEALAYSRAVVRG